MASQCWECMWEHLSSKPESQLGIRFFLQFAFMGVQNSDESYLNLFQGQIIQGPRDLLLVLSFQTSYAPSQCCHHGDQVCSTQTLHIQTRTLYLSQMIPKGKYVLLLGSLMLSLCLRLGCHERTEEIFFFWRQVSCHPGWPVEKVFV